MVILFLLPLLMYAAEQNNNSWHRYPVMAHEQPMSIKLLSDYKFSQEVTYQVVPFLSRKLRDSKEHDKEVKKIYEYYQNPEQEISQSTKNHINTLVVDSLKEVIIDKQRSIDALEKKVRKGWTRRQVSVCAAFGAVTSTVITAAVSLIVHYSS